MRQILKYLATTGAFLYEDYVCVISASEYVNSFGGVGNVILDKGEIQLNFWLERDRLFMDIKGISGEKWYSMEIVHEYITGDVPEASGMDSCNTEFLKDHFQRIQACFTAHEIERTERECKRLEKKRAKELFG